MQIPVLPKEKEKEPLSILLQRTVIFSGLCQLLKENLKFSFITLELPLTNSKYLTSWGGGGGNVTVIILLGFYFSFLVSFDRVDQKGLQ